MTAQELVAMGYGGYAGWGDREADADFNATSGQGKYTGGGGGGGLQSADQIISNSYQKMLDDYGTKSKEFDTTNPFAFDEVLATKRTEVGARLDPYYTQTLNDFLRGITTRRTRGAQDEQTVLAEISADAQNYLGRNKELLDQAIDSSNQGFSNANLFFSGARMRKEGLLAKEAGQKGEDYMTAAGRRTEEVGLTGSRLREDLTSQEALGRRDIEREKVARVETEGLKETNLAQLRRDLEKSQYLGSPFSSGSLSNISSYFSNAI